MVQLVSGRSGPNLSRRDGIAAKQKVLPPTLNIKRMLHHLLDHAMPPRDAPLRGFTQHRKLTSFQNPGELRLDQLTNGGLTHPASACDEKKHRSTRAILAQADDAERTCSGTARPERTI